MAASRIPPKVMSLKQFMVRQQVISLYRDVFRALRAMPDDAQKKEVKAWAKEEFRRNQHHTDEMVIKMMLTQGKQSLRELQKTVNMAR
ncbi:LYR motif-containing protein 2 [Strongylocentrotus purpuratus]|uniref:LYR motif-containing protein 2 n=1 Tax=Strongylocentrotus purpuratus TaxID=7668 RepID=H3HU64_STRPU|nr:LYR motif-containing protein 2 [Strongylocentrotus purpuratus]XP_793394.1 LYR motif-containing protein 2 [Strongylocentrotus purpuratus]|eukprot:XP_789906.2 PREDICTED: LYR motif-containing protein 2 [Strongylocentrotus purpuratus]